MAGVSTHEHEQQYSKLERLQEDNDAVIHDVVRRRPEKVVRAQDRGSRPRVRAPFSAPPQRGVGERTGTSGQRCAGAATPAIVYSPVALVLGLRISCVN